MASELRVNTLKDASGNNSIATSVVFNGIPKAWNNVNMTGTAAVRDSYNFSGFTDNGTGDFTVTIVSAMSDTNYSHASGAGQANTSQIVVMQQRADHSPTTTSVRYQVCFDDGDIYDAIYAAVAILGDLA